MIFKNWFKNFDKKTTHPSDDWVGSICLIVATVGFIASFVKSDWSVFISSLVICAVFTAIIRKMND